MAVQLQSSRADVLQVLDVSLLQHSWFKLSIYLLSMSKKFANETKFDLDVLINNHAMSWLILQGLSFLSSNDSRM